MKVLLVLLVLFSSCWGTTSAWQVAPPLLGQRIRRWPLRNRTPFTTTSTSTTTTTSTTPSTTSTARHVLQGLGVPSHPGWKSGRLNRLTDWADNQQANRPIVCEYHPSGAWLWLKWRGTVLKATWKSLALTMLISLAIDFVVRGGGSISGLKSYLHPSWSMLSIPSAEDPCILRLSGIKKLWEYQLTLATFILTFFLSQAFAYWQKVYNTTRMIQGRINDFCMLLNMGATRGQDDHSHDSQDPNSVNGVGMPRVNGVNGAAAAAAVPLTKTTPVARSNSSTIPKGSRGFSKKGEELVELCSRLIRLSHTFFWAATATASNGLNDNQEFEKEAANCPIPVNGNLIGPILLSPYGLKAIVNAGLLTNEEKEALTGTGLPPSQYAYVLLVWAGIYCMDGFASGALRGGPGFEENLLRNLATLRASMFDIDDFRAGRMPLAYVQLVQVLVDSLVWISPFALYPELGILSTVLVGLLALFFRGLLALSKSFLDPFGVEGHKEQNIRVDVLVSELNFGAAKRWNYAAGFVPRPPGLNHKNKDNMTRDRVPSSPLSSFQANGPIPSKTT
eukprot:scaffold443_cov177-Amphora_coffeaeformis.AAC.15